MMPPSVAGRNVSNLFKKAVQCIVFIVSLLRPVQTNVIKFISERYDRNHVQI